MIHGHGDDGYKYKEQIKINFSSNVWRKGTNEALINHLKDSVSDIGIYPEADAESLKSLLASRHNLFPENIIVTNGATEAFYLLAQSYAGLKSAVFTPTFAEYQDACNCHNHTVKLLKWSAENIKSADSCDLVWICNPNNPTGDYLNIDVLSDVIRSNPKSIYVIDEAYVDFTDNQKSLVRKVHELENLIVVKSLTKKYCIPGLRLGYIVCSEKLAWKINYKRMPWSVNHLALSAGKYILNNDFDFEISPELKETKRFIREINKLDCFEALDSSTTFFLVKLRGDSRVLKEFLIENHNILIRDASNFYGLDNTYIRIATQSKDENNILINALQQWMSLY